MYKGVSILLVCWCLSLTCVWNTDLQTYIDRMSFNIIISPGLASYVDKGPLNTLLVSTVHDWLSETKQINNDQNRERSKRIGLMQRKMKSSGWLLLSNQEGSSQTGITRQKKQYGNNTISEYKLLTFLCARYQDLWE